MFVSEVLQAHLEGHLDRVDAGVREALATWRGARRKLHNELTRRLGVLSSELAIAERRFFERVGAGPLRSREESWRAFEWLASFDRERMRIENEVWSLLRAGKRDEAELLKGLRAQADALTTTRRSIGGAVGAAVEQALGGDDTVGGSELGRELGTRHARRLDEAEARLLGVVAAARRELDAMLARAMPDWSNLSKRFETLVAEQLGADGAEVIRERSVTARERSPARRDGPKRKRARVPKFLIKSFYQRGSLRRVGDDTELVFANPLAFCIIQNGDPILVDGRAHPAESTLLDTGDKRIPGNALSEANYLKYPRGCALKVTLSGRRLDPGRHRINMSLELRKMGWIDLDITDEVQ